MYGWMQLTGGACIGVRNPPFSTLLLAWLPDSLVLTALPSRAATSLCGLATLRCAQTLFSIIVYGFYRTIPRDAAASGIQQSVPAAPSASTGHS